MSQFIKEKQNRNNKVSIEYPARLTVNGRTVLDEFPDWYSVLQQDRYQLSNTLSQPKRPGPAPISEPVQMQNSQPSRASNTVLHTQNTMRTVSSSPQGGCDFHTGVSCMGEAQPTNTRTYAQAVSSEPQVASAGPQVRYAPVPTNIPRYTCNRTGNQVQVSNTHEMSTAAATDKDHNGSVNAARLTGITDNTNRNQSNYMQL